MNGKNWITWTGLCFGLTRCSEDVKLLIPEKIYAVPGVEMNVYFNNVVTVINPANYVFDVDCSKGRNDLKRWRFTPEEKDVGSWKWEIRVIGRSGVIASAKSELIVLPKDAGKGRKLSMLMVGASQTGAGLYPNRIVIGFVVIRTDRLDIRWYNHFSPQYPIWVTEPFPNLYLSVTVVHFLVRFAKEETTEFHLKTA